MRGLREPDGPHTLLNEYLDPYLGVSWPDAGALVTVEEDGETLKVSVRLGYPAAGRRDAFAAELSAAAGGRPVELDLGFEAPRPKGIRGVKHIIAVASGKGGVGKSTTAVNLALALDAEGARVGLLDADIYGPSLGVMLGVPENRRPEVKGENNFVPIKAHGVQAMSMSFLVTEKTPMVWRGPMATGALQQLLGQSLWDDLDYLIVDMPPGTGDIQLTLSQRVPVSGAVIVTTPQDLALSDARKAIEMFAKVDIPVLGVVENMSYYRCPECGAEQHVFGEGGGAKIAGEYDAPLLGRLPLDLGIREQADGGRPTVVHDPNGPAALAYRDIARFAAARLWRLTGAQATPSIQMSDD